MMALRLALVAALLVLGCTAALVIVIALSGTVGFAAAVAVVIGGLVVFLWRVSRRDRAKRAHIKELPPI